MAEPSLKIKTVTSRMFAENCYLVHLEGRPDCIVIDPGLDPERILAAMERFGLEPAAILITHGHADHIAGNRALKGKFPTCPLVVGQGDAPKLTDATLNLSADYGMPMVSPPADRSVVEGEVVEYAGLRLEVLETPGHSSGHVVFLLKDQDPWILFGGDVLFRGSVGRTDFPDGDFEQLRHSIQVKLFSLEPTTVVFPGHGGTTTIAEEIESNPYVGLNQG